jgi:hypothetical protein
VGKKLQLRLGRKKVGVVATLKKKQKTKAKNKQKIISLQTLKPLNSLIMFGFHA